MNGIDTNVLLRYLLRDGPDQWPRARKFILEACSSEKPGYINRVVLCELVWVLERGYGQPREQVVLALEKILQAEQFKIEDHQEARLSLQEYRSGADFSDAFLSAINLRAGCDATVTFDRKAARRPGFRAL